jgi:hypothetical protein
MENSVEQIVNPLRQKLAARGERLYVNLNYVDFAASAFEHATNPEEYAEYMLAAFRHLQTKYGWVPDAVEIILEPDNTGGIWTSGRIASAIVATGDRLKAAGFRPHFIAPSNTDASGAVIWFDAIIQAPRVREYLTDFAYHRYLGVTSAAIQAAGARTTQWGVRTGMSEKIAATYQELHEDLEVGRNSFWQQFALAHCGTDDGGGVYYEVEFSNPSQPTVYIRSRSKFLRQYFLFIRLGAVRVGATSGDSRFAPLAFRNTNGKYVVVVKAAGAGAFDIRQLPAGRYGLKYTTDAEYNIDQPDVTIGTGGAVRGSIPAAGVITIYQR